MLVSARAWWRSIDHTIFGSVFFLMLFSALISFSYSPKLGLMFHLEDSHFAHMHLAHVILAFFVFTVVSTLATQTLNRLFLLIFSLSFLCMLATIFVGSSIKGSQRWISIFGISLQPSEYVRATLPIVLSSFYTKKTTALPFYILSGIIMCALAGICFCQPDIGMAFLLLCIYFSQLSVVLPSLRGLFAMLGGALFILCGVIFFSPHARARLFSFFENKETTSQTALSLKSFIEGSFFGVGPGDGQIKSSLPDVHSDFIFALIGEEFGAVFCVLILSIYMIIIQRSLSISLYSKSNYITMSCVGASVYLGSQFLVNTASVLNILPPKGTTLPFLSYGGSALLGAALVMGALLNIARKHVRSTIL